MQYTFQVSPTHPASQPTCRSIIRPHSQPIDHSSNQPTNQQANPKTRARVYADRIQHPLQLFFFYEFLKNRMSRSLS
jgi:hypothetical protein